MASMLNGLSDNSLKPHFLDGRCDCSRVSEKKVVNDFIAGTKKARNPQPFLTALEATLNNLVRHGL